MLKTRLFRYQLVTLTALVVSLPSQAAMSDAQVIQIPQRIDEVPARARGCADNYHPDPGHYRTDGVYGYHPRLACLQVVEIG